MNNDLRTCLETDVIAAAKRLLGCELVRGERCARIVETEAYRMDEPGCHAFRGPTPRTQVMFGPAGHAYVYFTYGCHWMLNVVAHGIGDGSAVLIRAAEPLAGLDEMRVLRPRVSRTEDLLSGPGKLAAAFSVGPDDNGHDLLGSEGLCIIAADPVHEILVGVRVGLAVGKGETLPWRFVSSAHAGWASGSLRNLKNERS